MEISVFPKKSSTFIRKPANIWLYHSWYWVELIYLEKNKIFFLATILDAILDFSARHQLFQFMPAVSETKDYAEHFGIWHVLFYGGWGGGGPGYP